MIFQSSFVYTLNVFRGGCSPVAVAVYACIAEVLTALCFVVVHCLPVCVLFSPACFLFCVCLLFFFLMWEALLMSVTRSNSFFQPFPKNRVPLPQGSMPAFFSAEGAWVVEMPLSHKHTSAWSPYVVTSSEVFHGVHSCVWLESC